MGLFGTACFRDCEGLAPDSLPFSLDDLPYAVSVGYRLSDPVMDSLVDRPTRTYQYHYRQVNLLIDHTLLLMLGKLHEFGYKGFPVPSSQIVNWEGGTGHLAHKVVASVAGLGWLGRNNLLVSPLYGARVRYGSLFTNAPLRLTAQARQTPCVAGAEAAHSSRFECGGCFACVSACPAGAIGKTRAEFDLEKCRQTLKGFEKSENIGSMICGLCIKACRGRRLG
jgi:epoxyqueuosine reductase QueG